MWVLIRVHIREESRKRGEQKDRKVEREESRIEERENKIERGEIKKRERRELQVGEKE